MTPSELIVALVVGILAAIVAAPFTPKWHITDLMAKRSEAAAKRKEAQIALAQSLARDRDELTRTMLKHLAEGLRSLSLGALYCVIGGVLWAESWDKLLPSAVVFVVFGVLLILAAFRSAWRAVRLPDLADLGQALNEIEDINASLSRNRE